MKLEPKSLNVTFRIFHQASNILLVMKYECNVIETIFSFQNFARHSNEKAKTFLPMSIKFLL